MSDDPMQRASRLRVVGGSSTGSGKPRKPKPPSAPPGGVLTEDAVALMFTAEYGQRLRFDHDDGLWAIWDADLRCWRFNREQRAAHYCRELARAASEGEAPKVLERVRRKGFQSGVEAMCRADPTHAVTHEVWNPDTMLLGCPGVTVDLRTGKGRDPEPEDMITRLTAVAPNPAGGCPTWHQFIDEAVQGDEQLERFLQQFLGYTLTGSVKEHQMVFIHGDGGNGKSLLLNTVVGIMGEYAQVASMESFAASKYERHSTDLAAMRGSRLVAVSEVSEGVGWNEQRLTQMTGGDKIRARFMRQDEFEFQPEFKLWVVGNHKPELRQVNEAMRRRLNMVPFARKPERPDPELFEKLKAEWPAILAWMIQGCLDWQRDGLVKPGVVRAATEEYFSVQDTFSQWLEECCRIDHRDRNCWEVATELFASWRAFCEARGAEAGNMKRFGEELSRQSFGRARTWVDGKQVRTWSGIMLLRNGRLL